METQDFGTFLLQALEKNHIVRTHAFHLCHSTGAAGVEGMLTAYRQKTAFVCVDDLTEATTYQKGGTWYVRRVYTVYMLQRYRTGETESYHTALNTCRELFRQTMAFLIDLRSRQPYDSRLNLGLEEVRFRELGGDFLPGTTGLQFLITSDEPYNLLHDATNW